MTATPALRGDEQLATLVGKELLEQLADAEHDSWARWMNYLFAKCSHGWHEGKSAAVIPPDLVERWKRQAATTYAELSESEKQSDRGEVALIVPMIGARLLAALRNRDAAPSRKPRKDLPTTESLSGSDPDFTGGLSSGDYLRKIRGGDAAYEAGFDRALAAMQDENRALYASLAIGRSAGRFYDEVCNALERVRSAEAARRDGGGEGG
jgi:hypothetical protein